MKYTMCRRKITGKGQYLYDGENDILLLRIAKREYSNSIEFGDYVVDFDTEDFVTGIQIMDASKNL